MTVHFLRHVLAVLLLVPACCSLAGAAGEPAHKQTNFSASLGIEFASGDYGTNTTTESLYMPLILTWFPTDRIDIGVEIPYIYQSNANVTTSLYQNNQTTTTAKKVTKLGGPGGGPGGSRQSAKQRQQPALQGHQFQAWATSSCGSGSSRCSRVTKPRSCGLRCS